MHIKQEETNKNITTDLQNKLLKPVGPIFIGLALKSWIWNYEKWDDLKKKVDEINIQTACFIIRI